jgi:hypothetical protein
MNDITTTLRTSFPLYPPHTAQRLAELVLAPRAHYRALPSYLHALDRVVHVTSGANVYPLPPAVPDMSSMGGGSAPHQTTNGAVPPRLSVTTNVGSDEALGGALLTPIPWLNRPARSPASASPAGSGTPTSAGGARVRTESTEQIDGPNGVGHIETVTVSVNGVLSHGAVQHLQAQQRELAQQQAAAQTRGVTQGELLRQEQRAGVVPVSQLRAQGIPAVAGNGDALRAAARRAGEADGDAGAEGEGEEEEEEEEEETPHARGPEEIGAADTGPQAPGTTFGAAAGGPARSAGSGAVERQGIDVEAAVGRRAEVSTNKSSEETADEGSEERTRRDSTPKREAEDEAGPGQPSKKTKGGVDEKAEGAGDVVMNDETRDGEATQQADDEESAD